MNGHSNGNIFLANFGFETVSARGDHAPTSAGTFPLRRAHYFSETGKPLLNADQPQEHTNLANEIDPLKLKVKD